MREVGRLRGEKGGEKVREMDARSREEVRGARGEKERERRRGKRREKGREEVRGREGRKRRRGEHLITMLELTWLLWEI